ncbi:MAG: tRNA(Ile)-lysidine synthase [Chlamydiia bacterium]|nr:tRNA(Ile)-lysidine synthase [Chlamydiia bacterium]MCH9615964.1 tRNA(Ile)-lysidine synthase [Chlamydiia bacterium]MCH9628633.1 tRNA(Ile)-lysidine synthase [Chlamydiia bacterium]
MKDTRLQSTIASLHRAKLSGKILIGFSGGPDSTALLHLLQDASKHIPLEIHLAHVDHGLREESAKEALLLKKRYAKLPFYKTKLEINGKNLEDRCREARLAFFKEIYKKIGANALCLGHHLDDQAETVLKRLFEGGRLRGLLEETTLYGMRIVRPLLELSKKSLISYLDEKDIPYLQDPTNLGDHNLRAKMRANLLPYLEEQFGKGIRKNLANTGKWAKDIEDYLETKTPKLGEDFSRLPKAVLRHFLKREGNLSNAEIETAMQLLHEKKGKKCVGPYEIHGGRLQLKEKLRRMVDR